MFTTADRYRSRPSERLELTKLAAHDPPSSLHDVVVPSRVYPPLTAANMAFGV
jgi:hypothetical protein